MDAFDWPTATTDLSNFSSQFGLPQMDGVNGDPTFTKFNQFGQSGPLPSSQSPNPAGSWAIEEALDVEWVHSIAPNANIDLVEASSSNHNGLYQATSPPPRRYPACRWFR